MLIGRTTQLPPPEVRPSSVTCSELLNRLAQQDMVALRAVMRMGWEIPNPVSAYRSDLQSYSPFAVYIPE